MRECVAGKSHIHAVGGFLEQCEFAGVVAIVGLVELNARVRVGFAGHIHRHSGVVALAQHLVAEVDYRTHLLSALDWHITLHIVVLVPAFAWQRQSGKVEVVVAQNHVVEVHVFLQVDCGELVVVEVNVLQIYVVAQVNRGEIVSAGKQVNQVRRVAEVERL